MDRRTAIKSLFALPAAASGLSAADQPKAFRDQAPKHHYGTAKFDGQELSEVRWIEEYDITIEPYSVSLEDF